MAAVLQAEGGSVEIEPGFAEFETAALRGKGHAIAQVPHIAGGMCGIGVEADGLLTGAACWRADGTAVGLGGGLARDGIRF